MISEDNKRKFQAIVASLSPEQRSQLLNHIQSLPENQRGAMVEQIIARYEQYQATKVPSVVSAPQVKPQPQPVRTAPVVNEQPKQFVQETPVAPQRKAPKKKKKLKTSVYLWAVIILLIVGIIAFVIARRDSLFANLGIVAPSESVVETEALPTAIPTPTNTPTPSPTPAPTIVPLADDHPDLTGMTVVLDAGHQETTDSEQELYASWLSATKPRCTSGGTGVVSGTPEYELTLQYCNIIRDYLTQCGAEVIMIREENDVNISNQERASMAVNANPDLFLRIHADSANDPITSGVRVYIPSNGSYTDTSPEYAALLALLVAEAEGFENYESSTSQYYAGLNYANTIRSFQLSLGFLSNSDDETQLLLDENLGAVAQAISEFCDNLLNG